MGKSSRENKEITPRRAGSFPSPSSSSSSDFEFTVSLSPSSRRSSSHLCPADELFYKGQLLPLHQSPRISMVRTLFLASSSTSSSSSSSSAHTSTTASRDSNCSSSSGAFAPECDSSRPSSITEEEVRKAISSAGSTKHHHRNNYFSSFANSFSSVFLSRGGSKKDTTLSVGLDLDFEMRLPPPPSEKKASSSAKQVIRKYVKKVKPLYDKLSSKNQNQNQSIQSPNKKKTFTFPMRRERDIVESMKKLDEIVEHSHSHSFSVNLRFPRRKRCAGSCPSSMRSSPTHSGLLSIAGGGVAGGFPMDPLPLASLSSSSSSSTSSSIEELQSAIQGAIAHCKSTMIQSNQKKTMDLCARMNHATCVI